MKDKEKQIKSDCKKCIHDKVCYDCLMTDKCWGKDNDCEHYQPKLPDDKLKYTWITDSDAFKKGSKETAEKIYKGLIPLVDALMLDDIKEMIKTEIGVEIG